MMVLFGQNVEPKTVVASRGQSKQAVKPLVSEYLPLEQKVQATLPTTPEKRPGGQASQAEPEPVF